MSSPNSIRTHGVALGWARRAPATWARAFYYLGVLRLLRLLFAPTSVEWPQGAMRLPVDPDRPLVIVANHASHVDTMVLGTTLPRAIRKRLVVAAAADYFFTNSLSSLISTVCIGAIPVDRTKVNRTTLELCQHLLGEGHVLLLYPEGGRSPDPAVIQPFKPGAAWIARRAGVAVLPVHLHGTGDVLAKGSSLPHRHRVRVRFGEPMQCEADEDARDFSARIEAAVRKLAD